MGGSHNLKVTGSNPVPATKKHSKIKRLESDLNSQILLFAKHINATSTFDESRSKSAAKSITRQK